MGEVVGTVESHRPALDAHSHARSHHRQRPEQPDRERHASRRSPRATSSGSTRSSRCATRRRRAVARGPRRHPPACCERTPRSIASTCACGSTAWRRSRSTSRSSRTCSRATGTHFLELQEQLLFERDEDRRAGRHGDRAAVANSRDAVKKPTRVTACDGGGSLKAAAQRQVQVDALDALLGLHADERRTGWR